MAAAALRNGIVIRHVHAAMSREGRDDEPGGLPEKHHQDSRREVAIAEHRNASLACRDG